MPKIFISATSRDLKSYRQVVADWATAKDYDVVVQEDFEVQSDYGTIVQMLRDKIAPCDAVIHLAGLFYGFEPTNRPDGEPRRSYTQLEYELGKELKRQVFRFIARENYRPDQHYTQTDEQRELQLAHRRRLTVGSEPYSAHSRTTGNELYYQFSSHDELRGLLDQLAIQVTLAKPNNLPTVGSLFKGRDEFLDQLRAVLVKKPTHIAAVTAKQAIHGLGGVGKTRVAIEYAKRFSHEYTALLFVTGDCLANLEGNLAKLCVATVLNLPEKDAREQEVQVAAVLRWLREHAGWFLIVDNVDTPEAAEAAEGLLQKLDAGHVVITSRLAHWGRAVEELSLDVLKEKDAQELLMDRTAGKRKATPTDDADALSLAQDLGYLPLALEQAGAFIVEDNCSFAEYRKLWKKHDDEVLTWHDQRAMKYPRSVATTWQTSFDMVGDEGRALLKILCWLAPDPIPLTMLEKLETGESDSLNLRKARRDLARYSFVKWSDPSNTRIEIHRLVQEITEYRLAKDERLGWLTRALRMVKDFIPVKPSCYDVRSWPTIFEPSQSHIAAIVRHADALQIAAPTARLMNELAGYLKTRGAYAEAEPLMRRALAIDEASFGNDHPEVATDLNNLAQLLKATNRLAEAEPLIRRALAICEASFGNDHPYVANCLNTLAELLRATNRLAEAESVIRRARAIYEDFFGDDHPYVANSLNNLAQLLHDTNRLAEAEPLMRRALAINEASFGNNHPEVATDLNNLAQLLQETNRLAEAEPLIRRALAIGEASFGNDHPDVAIHLNNLAQLLQATNRLAEADPLLRRALAIVESSVGNDHPYVAKCLNNLAQLLYATYRLADAEPLFGRALAISEASFGSDHPDVAIQLNNLSQLLRATNRLAEAEPMIRRAFVIFLKSLDFEHPYTQTALGIYRQILRGLGQSAEEAAATIQAVIASIGLTKVDGKV